jgi:hypothetical protein
VKFRAWALGGVLLFVVGFSFACGSEKSGPRATPAAPESQAWDGAFPPSGPVELRPTPSPTQGTLYQLLTSYDGRTEVSEEGAGSKEEGAQELFALEIEYRALPVPSPDDEIATSLDLEALKRKAASQGQQHVVEIGDDRLRVSTNDKVGTDLRGAQPKQDLTPRSVLGKSFGLLIVDRLGNPKGFTLRGVPSVKKLLASMNLREPITYMQIGAPDHPVLPGEIWHEKRFFPNPIGRLGLAVDIELRLVGFEKIGDAGCAHVSMRGALDSKDVKSESGFKFDEVRYSVAGEAWLDLRNAQVVEARLEDVSAVSHHRSGGAAAPTRARMRYTSRSVLKRLDQMPGGTTWADGTKRFSAVK